MRPTIAFLHTSPVHVATFEKLGRPVLMVAALESTLAPTMDLLLVSSKKLGTQPLIESLVVRGAWAHFLAGKRGAFTDAIVEAVVEAAPDGKVIVLAQASMPPLPRPWQSSALPRCRARD